MDISKNLFILVIAGQILFLIGAFLDLLFFHVLKNNEFIELEVIFLAVVIIALFVKSYMNIEESYFNGKKENQRKYD